MRFRNPRALLICGISAAVSILLFYALPATVFGGSCDSTHEIISNNMIALAGNAGSDDTLWIAGNDPKLGLGLNDTIAGGSGWGGQYLGCYANYPLQCLAFGGGTVAALLVPVLPTDTGIDPSRPNLIWHRTFNTVGDTVSIQYTPTGSGSGPIYSFAVNNAVYTGGNFYFSCTKGGVIKWNPSINGPKGFIGILPGDPLPFPLDSVNMSAHPLFGTSSAAIRSIDRYDDSALVAATVSRVWILNYSHNSWDSSSVTTALSSSTMTFDSLSVIFANNNSPAPKPLLYALLYYTQNNGLDSGLFRYHYGTKSWSLLLSPPQTVIAPASRNCFYAVDKVNNNIQVFRDSLADSVVIKPDLQPVIPWYVFISRLNITIIPQPQQYNDILFMPTHDSTGHLYIATGTGLYSSWTEVPGITTDLLAYTMRPTKAISGGLSQTYAVPGILTDNFSGLQTYTTFVYKLSHDANVTIEVFDYNMQLTRLVTNNQPRKAATSSGRSTNAALDRWDGRTDSGRLAAPGVYYYKITASTGERSFGKIVVAKATN